MKSLLQLSEVCTPFLCSLRGDLCSHALLVIQRGGYRLVMDTNCHSFAFIGSRVTFYKIFCFALFLMMTNVYLKCSLPETQSRKCQCWTWIIRARVIKQSYEAVAASSVTQDASESVTMWPSFPSKTHPLLKPVWPAARDHINLTFAHKTNRNLAPKHRESQAVLEISAESP